MGIVASVEDVLARVAMFSGRSVDHRRLPGGLSHQIWLVTCGGRSYVLRVLNPAVSASGLGVAPGSGDHEHATGRGVPRGAARLRGTA